jgi:uncharacterized membrane protein
MQVETARNGSVKPGIWLGLGLGALIDGIVLHQLLQWHHLVSAKVSPTTTEGLKINTLWDGLFHALAWVLTLVGVWLLWRATRQGEPVNGRRLFGGAVFGWGLFNLIDGTLNHLILQTHHLRPGPNQLAWDLGFLAFALLLLAAGWLLFRQRQTAETT